MYGKDKIKEVIRLLKKKGKRKKVRKKIIKIIAILFAFLFSSLRVSAANNSVITWELDKTIFVHTMVNGEYQLINMPFLTVDDKVVYCMEPGVVLKKGETMLSTSNVADTNIKKDVKKASLIGYYGYKKFGHNDPKYYLAAQKLIWLEMGASSVKYTYDREGKNEINITYYENEILRLVNNYDTVPSFDMKDEYIAGESVTLNDKNNVLQDYDVYSPNTELVKSNNNITLKIFDENKNYFTVRKKSDKTKTVYYYKPGLQTVASFGFPYDVSKEYNLKYTYGSIEINKLDFDNKENKPYNSYVSLEGAEYTLYDDKENIVDVKKTDKFGHLVFDKLKVGNYVIKETKAPLGYMLDETEYKITIDSENITYKLDSFEKVKKVEVNITKLYNNEETSTYELEKNIKFGLYDDNGNFIEEKVTDAFGKLTFYVPFGKYVIKQLSSPVGIDKVEDISVLINEESENLNYTLINNKIKYNSLPQTGKNINILLISLIAFLISFIYKLHEKNS